MIDRNALTVIEGDALLADTHIQQALGYGRVNDLHRIIKKHQVELEGYGRMLCRTGKASSGQTRLTYYLNEPQATLVCMFSRTERAAQARRLIVEVFTAWRKGQLDQMPAPAADPFEASARRAGQVVLHGQYLADMDQLYMRVSHLPIWRNGRRPAWWANIAVRKVLTDCHRQMTLQDCVRLCEMQTGVRMSLTTLQRYWALLDKVRGTTPEGDQPKPKGRAA